MPLSPIDGIVNYNYIAGQNLLQIRFHTGFAFQYSGVSSEIFGRFVAAQDRDAFFKLFIDKKFPTKQILDYVPAIGVNSLKIGSASVFFSNSNNVSFGISGSTITASAGAGSGGGIGVSISGNTSGTPVLITSGTLYLGGGNNITLSQNGNSITVSGANAISNSPALSGSNGSFTFSTATFGALNGFTFYTTNGSMALTGNMGYAPVLMLMGG